jgi:DNA-binding MarR family transcriptional regulator
MFPIKLKIVAELEWLDPDEQRLFRAFARSARWLYVQFDRDLQREVEMPRAYFEILWLLHNSPDGTLRMSDLAAATGTQPSRITHAVSRLEEAGHVRRELCTDDRRGWFTVLTDEGLAALQAASPHYAKSVREHLVEPLSREQREQLSQIGETLLAHLESSGAALPSGPPASKQAVSAGPPVNSTP